MILFDDLIEQLVVRQALYERREAIKTQISAHKALGDQRTGNTKAILIEYEDQLAACQRILTQIGGLS